MSEPFLGEIRTVAFTFAPQGWALCNGQLLAINQNQALFALLGTTYGGDGRLNFALPDLRGRVPLHFGSGINLGQAAGAEVVTLTPAQTPPHAHAAVQSADFATNASPEAAVPAAKPRGGRDIYASAASPTTPMNAAAMGLTGGNQPHENRQPSLVLNFVIALQGIFPSRS